MNLIIWVLVFVVVVVFKVMIGKSDDWRKGDFLGK